MAVLEVLGGGVGDAAVPGMIARAAAVGRVVLGVWPVRESTRLLGRFHATRAGVVAYRRHTGGPVVSVDSGHVRMALALPHRSAIVSTDPLALRPEQAMNRCVRGLMDACRMLGLDVSYPGRDVVTARGVPIGWLSLGEEPDRAAIFEAGLSSRGGVAPEDAASALVEAYRARDWDDVADLDRAGVAASDPVDLTWTIPPEADLAGEVPTMLGALGAHVGVDDRRRFTAIRVSGDVIAPVETIRAIEDAVLGVPALRTEIERAVEGALADEARWVLGIDGPRDVAAAVMKAIA